MLLQRIRISRIRNLTDIDLTHLRKVNIYIGNNGSGKSSLLEAIYMLSTGRSFRTSQIKQYLSHGTRDAVVFAELQHTDSTTQQTITSTLALQKFIDGKNLIKINREASQGFSQLAQRLPVVVIDPSTLTVFEEGTLARRQLFDWVMFHVEPKFYNTWLRYQRILKQRNSLLKSYNFSNKVYQLNTQATAKTGVSTTTADGNSTTAANCHRNEGLLAANTNSVFEQLWQTDADNIDNISYWEIQLSECVTQLSIMRQAVFAQYNPIFVYYCTQLLGEAWHNELNIALSHGLPSELNINANNLTSISTKLRDYYHSHRHQDIERGYTYYGAHRADIRVKTTQGAAEHELSRGQKKLLLIAFKLAQIQLLHSVNKPSVVLLDDIVSELDPAALTRLLAVLAALNAQVFITALPNNQGTILSQSQGIFSPQEVQMFHVEHGSISVQS